MLQVQSNRSLHPRDLTNAGPVELTCRAGNTVPAACGPHAVAGQVWCPPDSGDRRREGRVGPVPRRNNVVRLEAACPAAGPRRPAFAFPPAAVWTGSLSGVVVVIIVSTDRPGFASADGSMPLRSSARGGLFGLHRLRRLADLDRHLTNLLLLLCALRLRAWYGHSCRWGSPPSAQRHSHLLPPVPAGRCRSRRRLLARPGAAGRPCAGPLGQSRPGQLAGSRLSGRPGTGAQRPGRATT